MPHTLNLTQGALQYLRDILQNPGWAKTTELIMRGGKLLVDVLPEPEPVPQGEDETPAAIKAWIARPIPPVEITEKQRDTIKAAVAFAVERGSLRAGPQAMNLLSQLGYETPE